MQLPTIAIIEHPTGDEIHPIRLSPMQDAALGRSLCVLSKSCEEGKPIVVLSSPATAVAAYSELVSQHFCCEVNTCEGLLRDGASAEIGEMCDCIGDFIAPKFGLVVIVVASDLFEQLIRLLGEHILKTFGVKKPFFPVVTPGMTRVCVA